MLGVERKRTERSGRPFVLMLLESGNLLKDSRDAHALGNVLLAISRATRETDVKGWYKDAQTVGVIFTELDTTQGGTIANAILPRMMSALASTLKIEDINEIRISFHVYPEGASGGGSPADRSLYPDIQVDLEDRRVSRIVKRSLDISGSLFALVLFAPLLAAIAIAVRLSSPGPVLFRQQRVGRYGGLFTFLKFRSMYASCDQTVHQEFVRSLIADEADAGPQPVYKMTADARITPLGRLLRRTSLDELPQLVNVLRGEMSLVGPRPAIPYEVERYSTWQRQRVLAVKPGITGLWQVGGRSRTKFADMVRLDLRYARSWTVGMDIKILLRTPRAVISGEGAY